MPTGQSRTRWESVLLVIIIIAIACVLGVTAYQLRCGPKEDPVKIGKLIEKELRITIQNCNLARLRSTINNLVVPVDYRFHKPFNDTLLTATIRANCNNLVAFLLEKGADVESLDFEGKTPLELAVGQQNVAVVEMLLGKGADPNQCGRKRWGSWPLGVAVNKQNLPMVHLLLKHGADLHYRYIPYELIYFNRKSYIDYARSHGLPLYPRPRSISILTIAVMTGNVEMYDELVALGAKIHQDDCEAIVFQAVDGGNINLLKKTLVKCGSVLTGDFCISTYLFAMKGAVLKYDSNIALLIAQYDLNPDAFVPQSESYRRNPNYTVLGDTIAYGTLDLVKYLIERKNGNTRCVSTLNENALMVALDKGRNEIIAYLMQRKDMCSDVNTYGDTVLHYAARVGNLACVRDLVEAKKMDVNVLGAHNVPPIVWAIQNRHFEVAKYLKKAGANVDMSFTYGNEKIISVSDYWVTAFGPPLVKTVPKNKCK